MTRRTHSSYMAAELLHKQLQQVGSHAAEIGRSCPEGGLLIGTQAHLGLDAGVLVIATVLGVTAAALLLPHLAGA